MANNIFMMRMTSTEASWAIYVDNNIDNVIGQDALYESMRKCCKGVMWKDSVASFRLNAIERILKLSKDLKDGTYKAKPTVHFKITSPKPREIASIAFTDRVYQRSLNDNAVYPATTRSFIYDNYACQKGKGTDMARDRLAEFLHRYYRKHGPDGWVAQFDIRGYYPNMKHDVAEHTFRERLDPQIYSMVERILREQYDGDTGYNPGSQLVQIAGISVLDDIDHRFKEHWRAELYPRYMDDFLVIHNDKMYLEAVVLDIKNQLKRKGFECNPKKTRIYGLKDGIDYLGFTYKLTKTGKVLKLIKSDNIKRQRRKVRRLVNKSKRGLIPRHKVDESYRAWRSHASKGNTFKAVQRMDAYYKSLWRVEE